MADLLARPAPPSYHHADFGRQHLLAAKGARQVVVCIPARDEEATIASIVSTITGELAEPSGDRTAGGRRPSRAALVDEVLVVDDGSTDGTADAARQAGAVVVGGPGLGKGEAMRLARGRGDIVVYLDGDVVNFGAHFVCGLLGPLLLRPGTVMVKGCYARPTQVATASAGGGRVTELVAKPLLSLLFPELAWLRQPLAGETALLAEVLDHLELAPAYGVEMGLLIDVWRCYGRDAIAEVDLDERVHRNRPLHELAVQARDVMTAALSRSVAGPEMAWPPFRLDLGPGKLPGTSPAAVHRGPP
jgi:glucosyl-3-phosphoglycerate synthase